MMTPPAASTVPARPSTFSDNTGNTQGIRFSTDAAEQRE